MLINSSLDILWLAIAAVILWIGIWLGLSAFYLAMSLKDARKIVTSIKKKLEFVDQLLSVFKKKTENTAAFIPPLIDGVTKLVNAVKESKEKDKKSKTKK